MNATTHARMKARVYPRYGSPAVLQLAVVEKPVPKDDQVLVRVQAASLNAYDRVVRGRPLLIRVFTRNGLRRPKDRRLGVNLAGRVEAVGGAVTRFRVGDEVYGPARRPPPSPPPGAPPCMRCATTGTSRPASRS
jgi:NADPH:quinone reductase-like Zn-dependent oxidoreductase